MTDDEALENGLCYVPLLFRGETIEPERKRKEADPTADEYRIKFLERIVADPAESFSVRSDARRLLEVADLRSARDFDREYSDFIAWRAETKQ